MSKFSEWFGRHRKTIGYVIGTLNIIVGVDDLLFGDPYKGLMFLFLGVFIILDSRVFKTVDQK
jgi:hypothetical protein